METRDIFNLITGSLYNSVNGRYNDLFISLGGFKTLESEDAKDFIEFCEEKDIIFCTTQYSYCNDPCEFFALLGSDFEKDFGELFGVYMLSMYLNEHYNEEVEKKLKYIKNTYMYNVFTKKHNSIFNIIDDKFKYSGRLIVEH